MAGAEARVAIAEDIVLDFSGLFAEEAPVKQAPESSVEPRLHTGEYKTLTETEKPVESPVEGLERQQAKKPYLDTQREREYHQRNLEVYRTYQDNIKTSSQIQTDILKGIKAGEDVYSLFLKAVKAISLMTSNTIFYSQIEADIKAIYGKGLLYKSPLQKELVEIQERLQRLRKSLQREGEVEDSRQRIKSAIKAHEAEAERLQELIKQ